MPRYIDADKVHEFVNARVAEGKDGWGKGVPYEWAYALTALNMMSTADVAPRAEVAREILQEVRQALLNMVLANSMGENYDIEKRFAEIEKKYTEPEPPKGE